ncbi:hypothetical protein LXL04_029030 [Taraxacum kok-saghyz]
MDLIAQDEKVENFKMFAIFCGKFREAFYDLEGNRHHTADIISLNGVILEVDRTTLTSLNNMKKHIVTDMFFCMSNLG